MSFVKDGSGMRSRIDRAYTYNEYWLWAFPDLQPFVNMSIVVHDTSEPYACFVKGQNNFFSPDLSAAQGYADGLLTDYLIHHAHQFALPWLLQKFLSETDIMQKRKLRDPYTSANFIAFEHVDLGLSLLIDSETHLPYAVRSAEEHSLYGPSNSDLILTAYSNVSVSDGCNIMLPHRFQTIYNSRFVLEDFLIDKIVVNPTYPESFFEGHVPQPKPRDPSQSAGTIPVKPERRLGYSRSEVHEMFETGLWGGAFDDIANISTVIVDTPFPDFKNIMRIYVNYPDYVQLLVEHENGFLITDAPAHRSKIILQWIAQNKPGKNITHVVPSHHHRDHAGGINDYLDAGATLVIPDVAKNFYNQSGRAICTETYNEHSAFVFRDDEIEFRSFWRPNNPHAEDWTFAVATKANADDDTHFVLYNADVVNPGTEALRWDTGAARDFLIAAVGVGVPRSTLLVGAHGSTDNGTSTSENLMEVAKTVGFPYPALTWRDWVKTR